MRLGFDFHSFFFLRGVNHATSNSKAASSGGGYVEPYDGQTVRALHQE
jgi:hypothetical protein